MTDSSQVWGAPDRQQGSSALAHIKVRGAVYAPGEYPFHENKDVLYYLKQAGGATTDASSCKVMILRHFGPQNRTLVFKLDDTGAIPKVRSGDVLVFDKAEALAANIAGSGGSESSVIEMQPKNRRELAALLPSEARMRGSPDNPFRKVLEQYIRTPHFKRLLNQIAAAQQGSGISSISILSYHRGEGRSFFTAALALAYARFLDSRVLILDTNRSVRDRSPILEAVAGDYSADPVGDELHRDPAFIDLLTTESLEIKGNSDTDFYVGPYLESVKNKYNLVLIDTCAISANRSDTLDPVVVANQVDSSILVTSHRSVHRSALENIKADFKRYNVRLLGTVFNAVGER